MFLENLSFALPILLGIAFLGFALSRLLKRNDVADVMWGIGFLVIGLLSLESFQNINFKTLSVMILLAFWSIRLSAYLALRSSKKNEDIRYENMKKNWGKKEPINAFLRVFLMQSLIMGVIAIPIISIAKSNPTTVSYFDFLGLSLFLIGFIFEVVSDAQMYAFKADSNNKGKVLTTGLWSYTRHPNYFGEILIWWGFFSFSIGTSDWYWLIISPILITFLIIKVSGITMLEKVMEKKGKAFKDYVESTPTFFPFKTHHLIQFFKVIACIVFLDFIWLGNLLNSFYVSQASEVARITNSNFDTIMWAAVGVYFFIPLGVSYFALNSNIKSRSEALFKGWIYGLTLYATYDFTNIALIKSWPLEMSLVDIFWGPVLCGLTALICFKKKA